MKETPKSFIMVYLDTKKKEEEEHKNFTLYWL